MSHSWIEMGLAIALAICAGVMGFLMRKNKKWAHSITAHTVLFLLMCGAILFLRQVIYQVLEAYQVKAISASLVETLSELAMALLAMQQIFQLISRLTHSQINRGNDVTSAHMIARVLKLAIFVVIVLLFGEHFGIGLSGLLAFGGIGGIAIGVAGKDMLSNLFSGVMLFFDRPFSIGDWISSPDREIEGTVVEIGWRITKIITFENRPLYVPNAAFSTISVVNPGRMTNRRITTTVGLRYEDASKVAAVVQDIHTMLKNNVNIDQKQTILVYFDEFADSSLNIMVYCFTKTTAWAEWLSIQQDVFLKIIEIVQAKGADFAFPSRTLYGAPTQAANPPPAHAAALVPSNKD